MSDNFSRLTRSNSSVYRSGMARYLCRDCPRCGDYLGIILREPGRNTPLQAVNGQCLKCGYGLAWIVVRGGKNSNSDESLPILIAISKPSLAQVSLDYLRAIPQPADIKASYPVLFTFAHGARPLRCRALPAAVEPGLRAWPFLGIDRQRTVKRCGDVEIAD